MKVTPGGLPLVSCAACQIFAVPAAAGFDDNLSLDIFHLSYSRERTQRLPLCSTISVTAAGLDRDLGPRPGFSWKSGAPPESSSKRRQRSDMRLSASNRVSGPQIPARRSGAEVFSGTLADWRAEYDSFTVDAVAMFHVLEHLDDPVEVLRECRSRVG